MSQTKVQLIAPIGVVTASTLETTGVLTATTFVGDIAGTVTGITSTTDNLNLGIITATSFAGDFTGIGSGLTGTPNVVAGVVTATKFVGNTPGLVSGIADGTNINAGIITATSFVGNLTGNAAGLSTTTAQLTLGIVTATSYSGSGANLDGVSSGPVAQQAVTANSSTTTIDLSSGNLIYMTQSANTTVAFANTEGNTDTVYLVRTKDDNTTERTLTWPSGIVWDGGTEPTIFNVNATDDYHVFKLTTRDNGATWYGKEVFKNKTGGTLWGWGLKERLGKNPPGNDTSPVQISTEIGWAANVGTGASDNKNYTFEYGAAAIKTDGTLWAWGSNHMGRLGQNQAPGTIGFYSSPIQIPGTTWKTLNLGGANSYGMSAIKTDGTLWAWGRNQYGQLGLSNNTYYSSPVQIPGTTWKSCYISGTNGGGTKTDGTLWTWGRNNQVGNLGHNNKTNYNSPKQVGSDTGWDSVQGGWDNITYFLKEDGTLWACGQGQMGINQPDAYARSSPTQIPGTTWAKTTDGAGYQQVLTLKTDGTIWSWGYNGKGTLGLNSRTTYSSPVQVPGTTWTNVASYSDHVIATKNDGTLWAWGDNANGQLGQSNYTKYSSPVQIPGSWEQGTGGNGFSLGWKA